MTELLTLFLKSLGCSQCQEFEYHESTSKKFKNWKLFLKKYEMFTAMILYNENLKKDISYIINKNESILLLDDTNEVYMKLEYVSNNEESKISILVPTDEYHELYQKIEEQENEFNKELDAYYIGTYNIMKPKI
jgi:ribosomal protein L33